MYEVRFRKMSAEMCFQSKRLKSNIYLLSEITQLAFTHSKLIIETLEQGLKYVQS